jgi:HK97 family phage portal protein
MTIFQDVLGSLRGGWRTYGPDSLTGSGAFASSGEDGSIYDSVNAESAMKLSAVWSCMNIRAETVGAMPLHLRDGDKQILKRHPLYNILHRSPNADMTAAEFWSLATAHIDMHGNFVSIIERGTGKKVVALTPVDLSSCKIERNKSGWRKKWKIGQDWHDDDDVLHLRGFTMNADWGAPRLDIGRQILSAQINANRSAQLAFKQGLKVGGFFLNEGKTDLNTEQLTAFAERLNFFGRGENAGKWMTLLRGMKPVAGTEFSVKPAEAQLLESRYFGIEEICRLFNVPPPLIGHTNKASSWASSLENLNLHFLIYSLQPTLVRTEQGIEKKLLTPYDIAEGVQAKFSMQGLLRGDTKTRQLFYASGLQNGYLNQDEVRDFEDMPPIPNGEGKEYRVQLNMAGAEAGGADDDIPQKVPKEDDK